MDPDVDSSRNLPLLQEAFRDTYTQDTYLCGSSLFAQSEGSDQWTIGGTDEERQLLAKLHCLYGAPRWGWKTNNDDVDTHCYARARVYDMRNYTQKTKWGPFKNDDSGAVDWEKIEAIITVLGFNRESFQELLMFPCSRGSLSSQDLQRSHQWPLHGTYVDRRDGLVWSITVQLRIATAKLDRRWSNHIRLCRRTRRRR